MSFFTPPAGRKQNKSLPQPVRAFATRDTPAAALVPVELHRAQRKLDDASIVVEHHYTSGTKHRTRLRHRIKVHSDVDFFGQQHRRRRSTRDHSFQTASVGNPAADL